MATRRQIHAEAGTRVDYQPKYKWHRTKIDANDVPTNNDWSGYDGEIVIGRIQKQPAWSGEGQVALVPAMGHGPRRGCYRIKAMKQKAGRRCGWSRTTMTDCWSTTA